MIQEKDWVVKIKCPECGSDNIHHNRELGENYCMECGFVIDDGMPEFIEKPSELVTTGTIAQSGKIVKLSWLLNPREKNLKKARDLLYIISEQLNLPDYIIKEAERLYNLTLEQNLSVGRSINSLMLACIYASCKIHKLPKTINEIIKNRDVREKEFNTAYKFLRQQLNLRLAFTMPEDIIDSYSSRLKFTPEATMYAIELLNILNKTNIVIGKNPLAVLGGVIYIASIKKKQKISQRQIANTLGIIEKTIRKTYKNIIHVLNVKFENDTKTKR